MSLILCPECGQEVSLEAVACPHCGRPIAPREPVKRVVVMPPVREENSFPPWAIALIALVSIGLIAGVILLTRGSNDDANLNVNVNTAQRRSTTDTSPSRDSRTSTIPSTDTQPISVPPSQTTTVPGTTTAPPVVSEPTKGTAVVNAKVSLPNGSTQAARNTKFYLLDKDLESILRDANVEPIEGNSLAASLGLAAVYPDKYGDFQRRAMRAVAGKVKFSGTTGANGSANLSGIAPDSYTLFAITRIGRGFALWNQPITITTGETVLNLSPQSVTEIPDLER